MQINVQPKYFQLIQSKRKRVEGRLFTEKYQSLRPGDVVEFCSENKSLLARVRGLKTYPTFAAMLQEEGIQECLPGAHTLEEAVGIYHSFSNYKEQELKIGVIAIQIEVV